MKLKRIIFLVVGCISLGLGCIGIILPILPTVPFFLVTVFCFANSSQKLHDWFIGTSMYKKHLESFVKKKGMTVKTKATIITSVTLLMGLGFCMMFRVPVGQIILAVVWVCHMVYFLFGVKTIKKEDIEKQYPYVMQLQLEHVEHKKTAKKLVRILNKNEHLRASLDTSNFVISIRSEQELDREEFIQTAQQVGCTVKPAETITEKETVNT